MAFSTDAGSARPLPAWQQKLTAFWRWWTAQLAQMVPERFASLGGSTRVPQVAIEGDELVLVEPRVAEGAAARVSLTQDAVRARAGLKSLLERAGESRARARLLLSPGEALVRRVTMPAATEENLAQVLAFEMDRLTPFRADEVYFDHRVVLRDAAAATLAVLLGVARRDVVDSKVTRLRELGATVEGVNVRDDGQGASLNLMPTQLRGARESGQERVVKQALTGAVLVLLLAVLIYPIWRKREQIITLHPLESRAQGEAQATDKLARELERLVAEYNFLLTKKHGQPPALAYIEEISRLLPDNTWVQQLDLKAAGKTRELQITGETASSSKLIEILEQSTLLQNAATRGTETRGSLPGTVRFLIAAEAKPKPLPETVSLAQLSLPVAPASAAPQPTEGPAPPGAPSTPAPAVLKVEPRKAETPRPEAPPGQTMMAPMKPSGR